MTRLHDAEHRAFASDNCSGAHPEALAALAEANGGHVPSYGADPYTAALPDVLSRLLGRDVDVYPVYSGTGANVISLALLTARWGAVVCPDSAHVNTSETGAPERAGLKLLPVPATHGKITPEQVVAAASGRGNEHVAQPTAVSITNATEVGTVHTPAELRALTDAAHDAGLAVHCDGTRLGNAAASLGVPMAELAAGIDLVSLGGTKNGLVGAEAVVVLDRDRVSEVKMARKWATQLASKMRFVSAQLLALYEGDLWLRSATHANAMAARVAAGLEGLADVRLLHPVEANLVFASFPERHAATLERFGALRDWTTGDVRIVASFDTTEDDVDAMLAALRED